MKLRWRKLNGRKGHDVGRELLRELYREETGEALPPIAIGEWGKPYLKDSCWHFSISHTQNYAFCVLAKENVAIDAEELSRTVRFALADKILSASEKEQYDQAGDKTRAFLTFWVLKEAEGKLSGHGLRLYPNHTHFRLDDPRVEEIEGCLVAVMREQSTTPHAFPRGEGLGLRPIFCVRRIFMLFDTHAHMDDEAFALDREELLGSLPEKGIGLVMNPGCSLASSRNVAELVKKYDYLYGAVGSHPDAADEVNGAVLDEYRALWEGNDKIKAIGEIGLDYHYEDIPREIQQKAFRAQMELARELNLPVIVHEREAHEDGMKIVDEFPEVKGVFHCYSGSAEMAKELVKRGWYIGFTGVLTFKNTRKAVEVATSIPLDRIVIETDCPYMSPEPFRGKRNDPGKLYRMAEKLAEIRGLTVEEIERITVENGKRLYRIL